MNMILTIQTELMSTSSTQAMSEESQSEKKVITSETVFKYINLIVVLIMLFCVQGFLNFREFCISKNIYVFSIDSLVWSLIGFIAIFVLIILRQIIKYSWYYLMRNRIEKMVHPKYEGEERVRKLRSMLKLSNDTIFYSIITVLAFMLFKDQNWFSTMIGGSGSCSNTYENFPNWPENEGTRLKIEIYYMIQLGIHFFSLFEMVVIKRKTELKFYEYVLHHSIAVSLILFSIVTNQIKAGCITLMIHDASDIMMAFTRFYIETANFKKAIQNICYIVMISVWIYCRIIVFPFCVISNMYNARPTPRDLWFMISFQHGYLLLLTYILTGMHLFWTFLIIKIGLKAASGKKNWVNIHDKKEKQID